MARRLKDIRVLLVAAIAATALALPATAGAHPGGLDANGGHHCWTNCASWGLAYGQYHCHTWYCSPYAYFRVNGEASNAQTFGDLPVR